jgi:hypothetical protein
MAAVNTHKVCDPVVTVQSIHDFPQANFDFGSTLRKLHLRICTSRQV